MPSQIEQNDSASPIDSDPTETQEWRDALRSLYQAAGPERTREVLNMLSDMGRDPTIAWKPSLKTPYVNTISVDQQPAFPGDLAVE